MSSIYLPSIELSSFFESVAEIGKFLNPVYSPRSGVSSLEIRHYNLRAGNKSGA